MKRKSGISKKRLNSEIQIKKELDLRNKKARLRAELSLGELEYLSHPALHKERMQELKLLDSETQAKVLGEAYRQMLSDAGVVYLG